MVLIRGSGLRMILLSWWFVAIGILGGFRKAILYYDIIVFNTSKKII